MSDIVERYRKRRDARLALKADGGKGSGKPKGYGGGKKQQESEKSSASTESVKKPQTANSSGSKPVTHETVKQTAREVLDGKKTIQAKTEKEAISKINKELNAGAGSGYKIVPDEGGYFGKYTLAETFSAEIGGKLKTRQTGSTMGSFSLESDGNGNYSIRKATGTGYQGQD